VFEIDFEFEFELGFVVSFGFVVGVYLEVEGVEFYLLKELNLVGLTYKFIYLLIYLERKRKKERKKEIKFYIAITA